MGTTIDSFINKVNSTSSEATPDLQNNLVKSFEKDVSFNEVYSKLLASKQESIKVREIVLESEIDFINSAKQLKSVFESQLNEGLKLLTNKIC